MILIMNLLRLVLVISCSSLGLAEQDEPADANHQKLLALVDSIKASTKDLKEVKSTEEFVTACDRIEQRFSQLESCDLDELTPEQAEASGMMPAMSELNAANSQLLEKSEVHKVISSRCASSLELHVIGRTLGFLNQAQVRKSMQERIELQKSTQLLGAAHLGTLAAAEQNEKTQREAAETLEALKQMDALIEFNQQLLKHPWFEAGDEPELVDPEEAAE